MKLINKENLVIFGLITTALIIYWRWFFNFSILTYGDWGFFYNETALEFLNFPFIWSTRSLGNVYITISQYPIRLICGMLSNLVNFNLTERIIYLWPSVFFALFGSYILSKKIFGSKLAASVSSIVYLYNTYFIVGRSGTLTLQVAFAFAPLIIYLFMRTLEEKKIWLAIITLLTSFVCAAYEIRAFYIIFFIILFYYIYYVIIISKYSRIIFLINLKLAIIFAIIFFLLSLYWLLGLFNIGAIISNAVINRELFGNEYMNILRSITSFYPFWTGSKIETFVVQPIPFYFWVSAIFAFVGLFVNKNNLNVIFFGFVSILGIFLAKQGGYPLPGAYHWLYDNFFGFNFFRESSKFYFLVVLGYSILIGSFISWLWQNFNKGRFNNYCKYVLTLIIILVTLYNVRPIVDGSIGRLIVSRYIPSDYVIYKKFILQQEEFFRSFWVPTVSRWVIYLDQKPIMGNVSVISDMWKNFVMPSPDYKDWPNKITEIFDITAADDLFDMSSIKYVVVPIQDTFNDDDFFIHYGGRDNLNIRNWYILELDKIEWLNKIDIGTEGLVVYENENYKQHIFSDAGLNYYQTNASEFGDFSQNQNLYLNADMKKNDYLFNHLDNIIIPIEADPNIVSEMNLAIENAEESNEKKELQKNLDLYTNNSFFKDFILEIPARANYKIYFKQGSVLANNENISIEIGDKSVKKDTAGADKEGWKYFSQMDLDRGGYRMKLFIGDKPVEYINSGDIVLSAEDLIDPIQTPTLEYKQINPTKYIVNVHGASESFPLIFSESFHPQWRIYAQPSLAGQTSGGFTSEKNQGTIQNENLDGGKFYDLLFRKPVLDDKHFQVNGFANAWWMNLEELKEQGKIEMNSSSTYDFSISIEFEPQKYFYIGLVVSGTTLLGCIIYLIYDWRKRRMKVDKDLAIIEVVDKNRP